MRNWLVVICVWLTVQTFAQDQVGWRGVNRTGIYNETGLLKKWPEAGPQQVLEVGNLGAGYSSPVVYKNMIYVTGIRDSSDFISAIDMSGKIRWQKNYGRTWIKTFPDNRCTPTLENDRIYLISGMGEVTCLSAADGSPIWKVDAQSTFHGVYANWGVAESVLVTDKAAIYTVGGEETSVIALDKQNGSLLWKSKSLGGTRAYASPSIIEKNGQKMILAQTANDLIALNPDNGEIIWNFNLVPFHPGSMGKGANTNTPLFYNNEIFLTSGYDHPALMLSLAEDGKSVSLKWKNDTLDCHFGGAVMLNGKIYSTNWKSNSTGNWVCLDWNTGKVMYEHTWNNKGAVIAADGMLYCYEEKSGNVALVNPNPAKFDLVSFFKVEKGSGPHWAHPAIYDGKLYVRHGDTLLVYKIKA